MSSLAAAGRILLLLVGTAILLTGGVSRAGVTLTHVAHTGVGLPGLAPGVLVSSLWSFDPTASADGMYVNVGLAGSGVDVSNDEAVFWIDGDGLATLVYREGTDLPWSPGSFVELLPSNELVIHDGTRIEKGPIGGVIATRASVGDPAPGMPAGATFTQIAAPLSNAVDQLFFEANASGAGVTAANDEGIWRIDPDGSIHLLVREADPAPGIAGDTFRVFTGFAPDDLGGIALTADLDSVSGLYRVADDGTAKLIGRQGLPAPGPGAVNFAGFFGVPNMRPGTGEGVFFADLVGTSDGGYYRFDETGAVALVYWTGDPAPGVSEGWSIFMDEFSVNLGVDQPSFTEGNRLFVQGRLAGAEAAEDVGVWMSVGGGALELLAREGPLPGLPPGLRMTWDDFTGAYDSDLSVTAPEQLLIAATLIDEADAVVSEELLLIRKGFATRVAGPGDVVEVAPGDFRLFDSVSADTGLSRPGVALSKMGEVVFRADFAGGGHGLFVAEVSSAVPGLGALGGAAVAAGLIGLGVLRAGEVRERSRQR